MISLFRLPGLLTILAVVTTSALAQPFPKADLAHFRDVVRPLLKKRCFSCHGAGEGSKGGLRLIHRSFLLVGGESGPAIDVAAPDRSHLLTMLSYKDEQHRMPPSGKLPADEIAIITKWVRGGAAWPDEPVPEVEEEPARFPGRKDGLVGWSYEKIVRPNVPVVRDRAWVSNPIDAFVRSGQEAVGLTPAKSADRVALIRRAFYDLIGLPPTPAEIDAFVNDVRPDAFSRIVDELLSRPQYGEKWGRHWLDLVRYAESYGHEFDYKIPHSWQYRDYVIRALNADVPWDDLLREHVAGDLLEQPRRHPTEAYDESLLGTGWFHLHQAVHSPVDVRQDEAERVDNQIDILTKTFLGLTVSCARCHDHKFDAISTADYYALAGFLQSSRRQIAHLDPMDRIDAISRELQETRRDGARIVRSVLKQRRRSSHAPWLVAAMEGLAVEQDRNGRIEAERLQQRELTGGNYQAQRSRGFSGDLHMQWSGCKPGDRLGLEISTRRSGQYELRMALTKAPRHGIVRIKLGDLVLAERYDLYDPKVVSTGPVSFGRHELKRGGHRLTFEITGAHPKSKSAFVVGIDWVKLEPVIQGETGLSVVARRHHVDVDTLRKWTNALADPELETPSHPLHALRKIAQTAAAEPQKLHRELDAARKRIGASENDRRRAYQGATVFADFEEDGFPGWAATGFAFGSGATRAGDWDGTRGLGGLAIPGIIHSGLLSRKHQGALRSRTFTITKKHIWYRLAGEKAQIRLVIDGYHLDTYNGLLFAGASFGVNTQGKWRWHDQRGDIARYIGHRAWIEILDDGDGWLAVDQIVFSDRGPPRDLPHSDAARFLGRGRFTSLPPLASAAAKAMEESVARVAQGKATRTDVATVDWMLRWDLIASLPEAIAAMHELAKKHQTRGNAVPGPMRALAMVDGTPEDEYVFIRGRHGSRGPTVKRRFLEAIDGAAPRPLQGSGRLQLAERMLSDENPLAARVAANRIFHYVFGRGIVTTPDNFGKLGQPPTHPELLDWLAVTFRTDDRWSIKRMVRRLVLTKTFARSSRQTDQDTSKRDPTAKWFHRALVHRLEGEAIRDAILVVSQRMNPKMYGPGVQLKITPFMTGRGQPGGSGPLDGNGRRTIYLRVLRNFLSPMMLAFDVPIPFTTAGRRSVSNVPAQALTLMNDPFVLQQAKRWAQQTLEREASSEQRIEHMYLAAFGRVPSPAETTLCREFLIEQSKAHGVSGDAWKRHEQSWTDLAHVLFNAKEFIFVD